MLAFDIEGLVSKAQRADYVIEMVPQVGEFVAVGEPLFRVFQGGTGVDVPGLRNSIAVGQERTMEQDPALAFRIMVDIANKGLSPAINDPTTPVLAIDQIHQLLRNVGGRELDDDRVRDASGRVRLVYRTPAWEDFVRLAVTEIRHFGGESIQIARRLRAMLEDLIRTLPGERRRLASTGTRIAAPFRGAVLSGAGRPGAGGNQRCTGRGQQLRQRQRRRITSGCVADRSDDQHGRCNMTKEQTRLDESREQKTPWKKWGPYLSERQWGTVREDYSDGGDAWNYFTHDQARSRAYRWGEDGLAGICDDKQNLCFALALWNGKDPIIKERLFGLTNSESNHGEDVKEYYFYLDSTPTHSYMKYLYKYPQAAYPYADLVDTSGGLSRQDFEYELIDTGVFDDDRYFDVFVEYAKKSPEDVLIRITVHNRGQETLELHVLPTLWFRNQWSWQFDAERPETRANRRRGGVPPR